MSIWYNAVPLVVTVRGTGTLRLLTYQSNPKGGLTTVKGLAETRSAGVTRFLVSFSHNYDRFALIWEGAGEAVYSIGNSLERKPVGKSWAQASTINWGSSTVATGDVTANVAGAVDRSNFTTIFIIPDLI